MHDIDLGVRKLQELKNEKEEIIIPLYDKKAHKGQGDRIENFFKVEKDVDLVLFEGWMLGYQPVPDNDAKKLDSKMQEVNENLKNYQKWYEMIDAAVAISVPDPKVIYDWNGVPDLERQMPSYQTYMNSVQFDLDESKMLRFNIDEMKRPYVQNADEAEQYT